MKRGIISFIVYIGYTLFGLVLSIWNLALIHRETAFTGDLTNFAYMVWIVIGGFFIGIGALGIILKLIQMSGGGGFFGFLCILFDLSIILIALFFCTEGGKGFENTDPRVLKIMLHFIVASAASLISNIRSLAR